MYMSQPIGPSYNSEVLHGTLEQVKEESLYCTVEPTTSTSLIKMNDTADNLGADLMENHGNVLVS